MYVLTPLTSLLQDYPLSPSLRLYLTDLTPLLPPPPPQERLEHFDEKYMKPLLISDNLDSSLARLYDKLVLDEHYANLYGPAAAAETKKIDISAAGEVSVGGRPWGLGGLGLLGRFEGCSRGMGGGGQRQGCARLIFSGLTRF